MKIQPYPKEIELKIGENNYFDNNKIYEKLDDQDFVKQEINGQKISWTVITYQKELSGLWKFANGLAAIFSTLATIFCLGACLSKTIQNFWKKAISGHELFKVKTFPKPVQQKIENIIKDDLKQPPIEQKKPHKNVQENPVEPPPAQKNVDPKEGIIAPPPEKPKVQEKPVELTPAQENVDKDKDHQKKQDVKDKPPKEDLKQPDQIDVLPIASPSKQNISQEPVKNEAPLKAPEAKKIEPIQPLLPQKAFSVNLLKSHDTKEDQVEAFKKLLIEKEKGKAIDLNMDDCHPYLVSDVKNKLSIYVQTIGKDGFDKSDDSPSRKDLDKIKQKAPANLLHVLLITDENQFINKNSLPAEDENYPSGLNLHKLFPKRSVFQIYIGDEKNVADDSEKLHLFLSEANPINPNAPVNPISQNAQKKIQGDEKKLQLPEVKKIEPIKNTQGPQTTYSLNVFKSADTPDKSLNALLAMLSKKTKEKNIELNSQYCESLKSQHINTKNCSLYVQQVSARVGFDVAEITLKSIRGVASDNVLHVFLISDQKDLNMVQLTDNLKEKYPSGIKLNSLWPERAIFRIYTGADENIKDDVELLLDFLKKAHA